MNVAALLRTSARLALLVGLCFRCELHAQETEPPRPPEGDALTARRTVEVPLLINGVPAGAVDASPEGASLVFRADDVRRVMEGQAQNSVIAELDLLAGQFVTAERLSDIGLDAKFDPRSLALDVKVPPEQSVERSFSLRNEPLERTGNELAPANFAAFLNIRGGYTFADSFNEDFGGDDGPATVGLDLGVKVGGFDGVALRSSWTYDQDLNGKFVRNFTQIIHDDYDSAVRYTLGDLTITSREFQAQPAIAGLSIERRFTDIQPFRFLQPGGREQFLLREDATVDVLVNGSVVQTLRLNPGRYNLEDFPLLNGTNNVQLRILNDLGEERFIEFDLFFAGQALEVGLSEFGVNVGVRSEFTEDGGFDYSDDPIATGYYRFGATSWLTPEVGVQLSEEVQSFSLGAVLATPLGAIDFSAAASESEESGFGYAAGVQYTARIPFGEDVIRFDLAATKFSEDYRTIDQIGPLDLRHDVSVRVGLPLPFKTFGSVGLRYADFAGREDDLILGATIGRNFGPVSVFGSIDLTLSGPTESRALISVTTRFGKQGAARASVNPYDGSASFELANVPQQFVNDVGWRFAGQRQADGGGLIEGELSYRGNRFEARATHQFATQDDFTQFSGSRTNISAGTAVVFADGDLSLSRLVIENFAIVKRHKSLFDSDVLLGQVNDRYVAKTDALGAAVLNELNSYVARDVQVDLANRPQGYTLEKDRFSVFPGVLDGYSIEVGDADYITIITRLVGPDGSVLSRVGGEAVLQDGPDAGRTVPLFTNSDGRMVLVRLREGRYLLRLFGSELTAVIDVREEDGALQRPAQIEFGGDVK